MSEVQTQPEKTEPHTHDDCKSDKGLGPVMLAFASSALAAVLGGLITRPHLAPWYASLNKPWFTPPNWAFPVAWNTLYILMAFAVLSYWQHPEKKLSVIRLYFLQLVLNLVWSYAFFASHNPLAGLVCLTVMWLLMLPVLKGFWTTHRFAGLLFLPYCLWISYALALNAGLYWLNH
ncbi:MAG: tryptophan-rich sensory protein [Vampirovibrionales bacterium]|nr:tryptophan-rich sensory protein [Vampirovibrionales bacterium]